jgi:hypothetical protein
LQFLPARSELKHCCAAAVVAQEDNKAVAVDLVELVYFLFLLQDNRLL